MKLRMKKNVADPDLPKGYFDGDIVQVPGGGVPEEIALSWIKSGVAVEVPDNARS